MSDKKPYYKKDVWDRCEKEIKGFKVLGPPTTDKEILFNAVNQYNPRLKGLVSKNPTLTETQLHLLWETLINLDRRNYFSANSDHKSFNDLIKLCDLGLMTKSLKLGSSSKNKKAYAFHVNPLGVLEKLREASDTLRQIKKELEQ